MSDPISLTDAEREVLRETWDFGPFGAEDRQFAAVESIVAARLAKVTAERDEARGERPSGFWSQREWEEWSNTLAWLLPEEAETWPGVNPEGAQESIIEAAIEHLVKTEAENARLRDTLAVVRTEHERARRVVAAVEMLASDLLKPGIGMNSSWDQGYRAAAQDAGESLNQILAGGHS